MSTTLTLMPYCMCYVRHIDGIEYHLNDLLAPRYVDVIEHNNIRSIDKAKNRRLQDLKVNHVADIPPEAEISSVYCVFC